jgi:hypothetical protein
MGMTEQRLHGAEIGTSIKHVLRARMAEGVRIASPIDAGLFCPLPNSPGRWLMLPSR